MTTSPDRPAGLNRRNMIGAGLGVLGGAAALSALTAAPADAAAVEAAYFSQNPVRVADSRTGFGTDRTRIAVTQTRTIDLTDYLDLRILFTYSVIINVTVVDTLKAGYLRLWETGRPEPTTSNINWWGSEQTYGNLAFVGVDPEVGAVSIRCGGTGGGATNFVIDLLGYFRGLALPEARRSKQGSS